MKTKLTKKYTAEYNYYSVAAGTEIEIISFPAKVIQRKGTKPFFVYGKTTGEHKLSVRVPFSSTKLNYSDCRKNHKDLFVD